MAVDLPAYLGLARACANNPGVVLADADIGHPIRFFS
jgi:hypothetical protein